LASYSLPTVKISIFLKNQGGGSRDLKKSQKSRYFRTGLTYLYKIWYADAKWVSCALTIKKFEFHKSKMAEGRHFENR